MKTILTNFFGIKKMSIYEKCIFFLLLIVILVLPIGPENVDVVVTYESGSGLEGRISNFYVNSGAGWRDEEGYTGIIRKNDTCVAHVKNYHQSFPTRFDPLEGSECIGVVGMKIRAWGITMMEYQGIDFYNMIDRTINIESIELRDGVVRIVPMNHDPEIYMSEEFNSALAKAMEMNGIVRGGLILILVAFFLLRVYEKKGYWGKEEFASIFCLGIVAVAGSILICLTSASIVVSFQNKEDLQYDASVTYVNLGEDWTGSWKGSIRENGTSRMHTQYLKEIDAIRIDPVASKRQVEIKSIEIQILGNTYAIYEGADLEKIIKRVVCVDDISFDSGVINIVPSNTDPEVILDEAFCDELLASMQADRLIKLTIFWTFLVAAFIAIRVVGKRLTQIPWIKEKGAVIAGAAIGIITVCILFSDILSGDYIFSYTNIIYQVRPLGNIGVATKGLTASDMADVTFAEMWHLYDGNVINNWIRYNVFGYSGINETYVLSPFMWFCYGVTSIGQLTRYILKDIIALLGMYLLLRNMKCTNLAAWMGGCIYTFSSAMVMWGSWGHTDVACLGPLLFFLTNRLIEEYEKRSSKITLFWLGIAFVLYVMLVAGMPPYVMYFLYMGVIYEIYNMLAVHKFTWKESLACIIIIALAIVLAGLMSFAYTGDMFFSTRGYQEYRGGEGGYPMHTADSWFLRTLLLPQFAVAKAAAIEYNIFSGIFVLFIIPAYFITKKNKDKMFWSVSVVAILVFVFSKFSGYVFQYIPLINTSRKTRLIVIFNFGISILSGLLISQLMTEQIKRKKAIIASTLWVLSVACMMIFCANNDQDVDKTQMVQMFICVTIALISVCAMVILGKKRASAMFLLMSIAFSGAIFAKNALQLIDADANTIPEPTESIQYLQEHASGEYRMATVGKENFVPDLNSYYGIQNLCGHAYVNTDGDVIQYLESIESDIYDITTKTSIKNVENWNLLLYGGVRYLLIETDALSSFDLKDVESKTLHYSDGESVIELTDALPRVYVATDVIKLEKKSDVLECMKKEYNPGVIYTTDAVECELTATEEGSSAQIVSEEKDSLKIEVTVDGSGYVVISDYLENNWKAYVNGKGTDIVTCNYLFNAIYLEQAGTYTIELVYHNNERMLYWMVTMIAWGGFLVTLLAHKRVTSIFYIGIKNENQNIG